jgi:hypothetical protein
MAELAKKNPAAPAFFASLRRAQAYVPGSGGQIRAPIQDILGSMRGGGLPKLSADLGMEKTAIPGLGALFSGAKNLAMSGLRRAGGAGAWAARQSGSLAGGMGQRLRGLPKWVSTKSYGQARRNLGRSIDAMSPMRQRQMNLAYQGLTDAGLTYGSRSWPRRLLSKMFSMKDVGGSRAQKLIEMQRLAAKNPAAFTRHLGPDGADFMKWMGRVASPASGGQEAVALSRLAQRSTDMTPGMLPMLGLNIIGAGTGMGEYRQAPLTLARLEGMKI